MDYVSNAQNEWNSLYVQSAGHVWKEEIKSLRNAKMLIHILDIEFAKIQNDMHLKFDSYSTILLPNPEPRNGTTSVSKFLANSKQVNPIESPDMFQSETFLKTPIRKTQMKNASNILTKFLKAGPNKSEISNPSSSITKFLNTSPDANTVIDEDNDIPQIFRSPTITRNRKYSHRKKKTIVSPCRRSLEKESFASPIKRSKYTPLEINSPTTTINNGDEIKSKSVAIINKADDDLESSSVSESNKYRSLDKINDTSACKNCETPTKLITESGDESTIIDVTPEYKEIKKLRSKTTKKDSKSKIRNKFKNVVGNLTLTQMYETSSSNSSTILNVKSEIPLDDILNNIEEENRELQKCNTAMNSLDIDKTYVPSILEENVKINKIVNDINEDVKMDAMYDFIKNYDKVPERIENKYTRGQVVRGKERIKLNAHDCPECEKFYELLPNGHTFLKECSKHRQVDDEIHHELSDCFRLDFTVRDINASTDSTVLDY